MAGAERYAGISSVWKFGYGSNLGPEFLRRKKGLDPLDSKPSVLQGWQLSFPEGRGIDFVEPSFAALKRNPESVVHGVSTLFSIEDAVKLNNMEPPNIGRAKARLYDSEAELDVEIYLPNTPLALDHPEGCCSERYRDILVKGAEEMALDPAWVQKLKLLPVYTPSAETLALRASVPSPSSLPSMTIAELAQHNGEHADKPHYISVCGFIFQHKEFFKVFHGRDITYRNVLHSRGINLDSNDDGGRPPFPRLSRLEPAALVPYSCTRCPGSGRTASRSVFARVYEHARMWLYALACTDLALSAEPARMCQCTAPPHATSACDFVCHHPARSTPCAIATDFCTSLPSRHRLQSWRSFGGNRRTPSSQSSAAIPCLACKAEHGMEG